MTQVSRLAALRHHNFRLLWGGQIISSIGTQMQLFAINWHVYQLLQNQLYTFSLLNWHVTLNAQVLGLGTLGAVRVLPIFLFAMLGGVVADRHNRRQLILWSQVAAGISTLALTFFTFSGYITVPPLYLFTAINVAISAFDEPAQTALYPELIPREHLQNATTLYSLLWTTGTIAGPALAGVLIASTSIGVVYATNTLTFLVALLAVLFIKHREQANQQKSQEEQLQMNWQSISEGFRFVWSTRLIRGTMVLDFIATFFASARTMLPFVADHMLHTGVQGYGLLAIAQPIGALSTGIVLALKKQLHRQGAIFLLGVTLYALATAWFGLSTSFILSTILFGLTGVGDTLSTVVRSNIRQQWTPPTLRGRMSGVQMILAFGGPQLGELEAGISAALLGVPFTIFAGGVITLFFVAWFARRYPELRTYTSKMIPKQW